MNGKQFSKDYQPEKKRGKGDKAKVWETLGEYIINDGAERYGKYLNTLEDKLFASEFRAILEYFKPKQLKTEIKGEINTGPKKIGFE